MKRQIVNPNAFLAIFAVFMLLAVQGLAHGQTVSIDPASIESPAAGERLTVNINITGGMNVAGYQVTVTFDPTALSDASSANGDYLPAGAFTQVTPPTDMSVGLGAASLAGAVDGDGTLATVTFTVVEAKDSAIGLEAIVSDPTATPIAVTVEGGRVTGTPEVPTDGEPTDGDSTDDADSTDGDDMVVGQQFTVTLTNLTEGAPGVAGQVFSPPLFMTHTDVLAFEGLASEQLRILAETGNNQPYAELGRASTQVFDVVAPEGAANALFPGASTTIEITATSDAPYLSLVAMLVFTNDGIVMGTKLPLFDEDGSPRAFTMDLMAYDAGTEENNELATHIPGFRGQERAPTEEVVAPHPGITGTADVGPALGWTEPVASVTVEAVAVSPEEPETPEVPEISVDGMMNFKMELAAGLNMISLPLMPAESYTASSLAEMIGATVVIRLDTATQEFVGFTADQEGAGFSIEGGQGYIVNVPGGGTATFTGTAWNNAMEEDAPAAPGIQLPNTGWAFVVSGDLLETEAGVSYMVVAKNQRTGEVATRLVSSDYKEFNTVWADLSRRSVIEAGDTLEVTLIDQWGNIVSGPFTHRVGIEDLRRAYLSLRLAVGDVRSSATVLGQNFPNPFNPETWIPYQLEQSADVTLQIYDMLGSVVRTIELGFQPRGFYMTRSTAAYWDGRNDMGEQVASGVYFYSLRTTDFSATRKMLILK